MIIAAHGCVYVGIPSLSIVHCTLYSVQCTVVYYSHECGCVNIDIPTLSNVYCTQYRIRMYTVLCTVYTVYCIMYSVQCIMYSVQCIMYSVQLKLIYYWIGLLTFKKM